MRAVRSSAVIGLAVAVLGVATVSTATAASSPPAPAGQKWRFDPTINAPWAHEADDEDLDAADTAAGLCRSAPFSTTNAYRPLGSTNVDVITGDAVNNSGASNLGCTTPQNETSVAVNPLDPRNLVAGANDYRVCCDADGLNDGSGWAYWSADGGTTWTDVQLPGLTRQTGGSGAFARVDSAGDPVLTFGPDGTAYYANIVFARDTFASGVAVSTSRDGGRTWSAPNMVTFTSAGNFFSDKEWIAAGPNGQVVVTWTRFSQGPQGASYLESPIVAAYSKDGGHTWNNQGRAVSDAAHPFDQGSQVAYGPDGALYVAYEGAQPSTGYATDGLVLARSTDGGASFATVDLARVYDDLDCYPVFADRQTLSDEHFRIDSYPSMSIDPVTGKVHLVWSDDRGAGNCGTGGTAFTGTTANHVRYVSGTWGAFSPAVPLTSGRDTVFPSVAARAGRVAVTYYTRDYATAPATSTTAGDVCHLRTNDAGGPAVAPSPSAANVCLDYAGLVSSDGGARFGRQARLTTESSNPYVQFADGAFIGDYSQVAMGADGVAHPVWTDFRGRPGVTSANQDVLTTRF